MVNNDIQYKIDEVFKSFYEQLEEDNFGLYIDPKPLNPKDKIKVEQEHHQYEEDEEGIKELDF